MAHRILVTGFEGFQTQASNPTAEVVLPAVKAAYGEAVETRVLPVLHDEAGAQLQQAIEQTDPQAIVMFGAAPGHKIRLETQARNWRSSLLIPDNDGHRKWGRIAPGAPRHVTATLPLETIQDTLTAEHVPARLSRSAGQFLCNEVMYHALQQMGVRGPEVPTGFIHVGNRMPQPQIAHAGALIVGVVLKSL